MSGPAAGDGGYEAPRGAEQRLVDMEAIVSRVLQVGVTAAAAVIALGLLLLLVTGHSGYTPHGYPLTVGGVLLGLANGKPYAWIAAGLLLLILTPVLRVAVSAITFLLERDSIYIVVTLYVLAVLIASFFLGSSGW